MDHFRFFRVCFAFWLIHCSLVSHAGKGWPLGSLERDVIFFCVFVTFSMLCPESGGVLDCTDS